MKIYAAASFICRTLASQSCKKCKIFMLNLKILYHFQPTDFRYKIYVIGAMSPHPTLVSPLNDFIQILSHFRALESWWLKKIYGHQPDMWLNVFDRLESS